MTGIKVSIAAYPGKIDVAQGDAAEEYFSLTSDSRAVEEGGLFAALAGEKVHGKEFISAALEKGAKVILTDAEVECDLPEGIVHLKADSARRALAFFAATHYPKQPEHMVAVTGTDGKTSTAEFTRQLMDAVGLRAASLGTLGVHSKHIGRIDGTHTTPDPVALHRLLHTLAEQGINALAMEASSHGLHQHRLDAVRLQAAAFTNIARDHMDYHKTEDEYFAAKRRLFDALLPAGGTAVVNAEDTRAENLSALAEERGQKLLRFGADAPELTLEHATPTPHGLDVSLNLLGHEWRGIIPLIGRFQAMNILSAIGLVIGAGVSPEKILPHIQNLQGVTGRMQLVPVAKDGVGAVVDYAHTPRALEQAMLSVRPHVKGKLIVVFGCGGDRDKGKRSLMGAVAAKLADEVIVADDNPRTENPEVIRAEVMAACPDAHNIGDRKAAIHHALALANAGDMVLVAGKGHEATQTIGDKVLPFNDAEVLQAWQA